VLALAATALLAVASAPLRNHGDELASSRWGVVTTLLTVAVGVIGIVAWTPAMLSATGWNAISWLPWYLPLWLLPVLSTLPVTAPRARRIALATMGGTLAALSAWGATLDKRMALAHADMVQLSQPMDSVATKALSEFGRVVQSNGLTTLDGLFAAWHMSPLHDEQVPSQLAVWVAGAPVEWVALDTLSAFWGDLEQVVDTAESSQQVTLQRGAGRHELLVVPLAGDTTITALIGPRSRLIQPTRFGRLVGWRTFAQPPYRLDEISSTGSAVDGVFRRSGRHVRADTVVTAGASPVVVRATVSMSPPRPFAVRAALTVLLDVGLALLAWAMVARLLGGGRGEGAGLFRHSYRRTIATALTAFFVVPAAFFSLWSALRLRQDVARERNAEVSAALREIAADDAFTDSLLTAPESDVLAGIAARVDAELGIYEQGRLVAASAPLLADLGLLSPVIDPRAVPLDQTDARRLSRPVPGANVRVGVEPTGVAATLVAAALPGADSAAEQEQVNLGLLLLLASLGGTAAAVVVAGLVARALGQPIESLRVRAVAIGRREVPIPLRQPPAEFEPVFEAIAQMEHDLRDSEARLEAETAQTSRIVAWGEMARQVAHEIKNPLTPMRLGLQHLRRIGADDPTQLPKHVDDTVERLLDQIERLDRIARSFARFGSPPERLAGPLEAIDLLEVCSELAGLFALGDSKPAIVVDGSSVNPVAARREELLQVMLNLLDNSRQAGAQVVRLEISEGRLAVVDDGRGIAAAQLPKIFEPTFSTNTSGTGLGLAIVRRLVESWGARVTVQSTPPTGTTFVIELEPFRA
jgi:signal transduction histidine kinase